MYILRIYHRGVQEAIGDLRIGVCESSGIVIKKIVDAGYDVRITMSPEPPDWEMRTKGRLLFNKIMAATPELPATT